jgi:hypothetical protein
VALAKGIHGDEIGAICDADKVLAEVSTEIAGNSFTERACQLIKELSAKRLTEMRCRHTASDGER